MLSRNERERLYLIEAASISKNMPDRKAGIICDFCHRKLRPVDVLFQYYDSASTVWRGTCRSCGQRQHSFWLKHYYNATMTDGEFHRLICEKIGFDILCKFYNNEVLLLMDRVSHTMHNLLLERFGMLENYYFERSKIMPSKKIEELPFDSSERL